VLGTQLAAAQAKEKERLADGITSPSPLAAIRYRPEDQHGTLLDPRQVVADEQYAEFCRGFAASDAATRERISRAIAMDEFYSLLGFARRSAVFAMRQRSAEWVARGLQAIAIIDCERIDWRDSLIALGLLHTAAERIGKNGDDLIQAQAAFAGPKMKEIMVGFARRAPEAKTARCMGYDVWDMGSGPSFVSRDFAPYAPTVRLDQTAQAICAILAADKYDAEFSLGSALPKVWLSGVDDGALVEAIQAAVAGVRINGALRAEHCPDHAYQQWTLFLIETAQTPHAAALERIASARLKQARDFSMLAVRHNRLFALVVARSFVQGKPSFENDVSLQRFRRDLENTLR